MKLNQIVGITKILSDRKIPEDIEKYLESDYWSGSKKQFLKKGDMDLFHFIRAVISDNKKTIVALTIDNINDFEIANDFSILFEPTTLNLAFLYIFAAAFFGINPICD